jgi:hypothetical protein
LAVGDFNRDGILDLVAVDSAEVFDGGTTVGILLGYGDGGFGAETRFAAGSDADSVAVGDFNGDGIPDLVVASFNEGDGAVSILLGSGTGAFEAPTTFAVGGGPGSFANSVAVGDFNADGFLDLAVPNFGVDRMGSDTVSVLLGTGTGRFGAPTTFQVGTSPAWVAVTDFNGDGVPDLAVANYSDGTVSVLLGTGTGSFEPQAVFPVEDGATSIAVGDFNGDGRPDLAVVCSLSSNGSGTNGFNTVSVLINTCQ